MRYGPSTPEGNLHGPVHNDIRGIHVLHRRVMDLCPFLQRELGIRFMFSTEFASSCCESWSPTFSNIAISPTFCEWYKTRTCSSSQLFKLSVKTPNSVRFLLHSYPCRKCH